MLDVDVIDAPPAPSQAEVIRLCELAATRMGIADGHVAVEFVAADRIAELNSRHRSKQGPTDVLSFPIDEAAALPAASVGQAPPRELGDVFICPEHTTDMREAVIHGMLHLLGMDHERDDGEMLAMQDELLLAAGA